MIFWCPPPPLLFDFDRCFDAPPPGEWPPERDWPTLAAAYGLQPTAITRLSGGYSHLNLRLDGPEGPCVLRLSRDPARLQSEMALLRRLQDVLPVPAVLAQREHDALISFCPGTLASRLELPDHQVWDCGAAIGRVLAQVHQQPAWPSAGFFGADLQIHTPLHPFGAAWSDYSLGVLARPEAQARVGAELCAAVAARLQACRAELDALYPCNRLVHADFNLKNLLMRQTPQGWQVTALLDWEFALAAHPLVDIGNFLRFGELLPPALGAGLLRGYREQAPELAAEIDACAPDWERAARLLDLAALCGFLEGPRQRLRTWQTVRARLQRSLHLLA
ncbi:MAG: phosphotransferase enzyme family protein [Candidatus Sericytochromatia bacterium]